MATSGLVSVPAVSTPVNGISLVGSVDAQNEQTTVVNPHIVNVFDVDRLCL